MSNLKAQYKDLYKKRNVNTGVVSTVFRYTLSGKEDDLKAYREALEAQGVPCHVDEASGKLIYFDTVYRGQSCNVTVTDTGRIVVADNDLDFLQSQLRLATDPALKDALATAIANMIVSKIMGTAPVAQVMPQPSVEPVSTPVTQTFSEEEANLDE